MFSKSRCAYKCFCTFEKNIKNETKITHNLKVQMHFCEYAGVLISVYTYSLLDAFPLYLSLSFLPNYSKIRARLRRLLQKWTVT